MWQNRGMGEIDWAAFERELHGGERPLRIELVDPRVATILRGKSHLERLAMVADMCRLAEGLAARGSAGLPREARRGSS